MTRVKLASIFIFFFLFGAFIVTRLFSIQVKSSNLYKTKSSNQTTREYTFKRGNIFARDNQKNLVLLATTTSFFRFYAIPSKIPPGKEEELAHLLSPSLNISEDLLEKRFSKKDDRYEPLKERISSQEKETYEELTRIFPEALRIEEYKDRFYPYGNLASHLLGFVGFEGEGRVGHYGIERSYNDILAKGDEHIIVTLDISIQRYIEYILEGLLERWSSPSGSIIIIRPRDGAVIAMASKPDFDPNRYQEVSDLSIFLNPIVQSVFEPGSIVKPITVGAGIERGKISPETTYVDKGFVEKSGYIIKNAGERVFGKRTMTEVLEFSINTGAVFIQDLVGQNDFIQIIEQFGFGQQTGIDLPGEVVGDITNLDSGRPVNFATASFGQGISATPLQIARALSVLANGGNFIEPYVVQEIVLADGSVSKRPSSIRKATVRKETAAKVVSMMVEVVEKGYSKKARVPGYLVAGKSGTAEIPDPKGGYLDQTIHSFAGFAPAFDPAFLILIKLDKPVGPRFSSESIAPAFSQITQYLLQYYGILPEKPTAS